MQESTLNDSNIHIIKKGAMGVEYLNNKVFEGIIANFLLAKRNIRHNRIEYEHAQKELADAFYLLAENIIRAFNFQLIDRDDALQEGVMICFEKIDRFRPEKGKAFNYMTTCCLNHYRQLYRTAKNYIELKRRYQDFVAKKQLEIFSHSFYQCPGYNRARATLPKED